MFRLRKRYRFEASHILPHHDGKCAHLHGHSWIALVEFEGKATRDEGPSQGMLLDYSRISKVVKPIIAELDHSHLNDHNGLENPTSEMLALWLFLKIEMAFNEAYGDAHHWIRLSAVQIEETCTSWCEWRPKDE